jgi:teichuronic acid exporter
MQGDDEQLNRSFIQYLRISCYIIFPLMVGLSVLAKPLVLVLLTEKWLPMSDLLSILCIAYMWYPMMVINNQILNVKGRADYFLKAEIIKKILAIGILVTTIPFGIKILCLGVLLYNLLDVIIIIYFAKKVVLTGYFQQIKSVLPLLMLSLGMGGCTYIFMHLFTNPWIQLFIGILIGPISYFIFSCFFRIREFKLVLSIVKRNRL